MNQTQRNVLKRATERYIEDLKDIIKSDSDLISIESKEQLEHELEIAEDIILNLNL